MEQSESNHLRIGKAGEDAAVKFLKKEGFSILGRNYWKPWGELDIVAKKERVIHFVEVKTVSRENLPQAGDDYYEPEDNIHHYKRQRLGRTIQTYIGEHHLEDTDWQIDVVTVYFDKQGSLLKIETLEDIQLA